MQPKTNTPFLANAIPALRFILPFVRKYRARIFIGLASLLVVNLFQLLIPRIIKSAIDGLDSGSIVISGLRVHAFHIILLALGVALFRFLWRYLVLGFSRLLEQDIRNTLFSHLLTLDRAFFQRRTTGELMALATNDLSAVQLASGMGLVALVDALVMTLAVLFFMAYIDPTLTLIAVCPLPFLALLTRLLSGKLHTRFRKVQEQFSTLTEHARSTISSIRLIKVYTREEDQTDRFDKIGRNYIDRNMQVATIQGILFPVSGFVANTSLLLVVVLGGRMVVHGTITIGEFVAFISYLFMMTWPMMAIGWVTNLFQRGLTSLQRIHDVLQAESVLTAPEVEREDCGLRQIHRLAITDVSFTYPDQTTPILSSVTALIEPGIFGIVGKTGSGKSTLCHLLARLYPVADHSIAINDCDINSLSLESYRRHVAYVPQESLLFSNSIAFNISFGMPHATIEQIHKAAMATGIHDEIIAFTQGYDTKIGERGTKLSGGQRQRIAMARALLTDAPILIIDDGLSAVDSSTEKHILKALQRYAEHKIVIIVSHRLSPLVIAKKIIVMGQGRIVDQGTHAELLEKNPYYQAIYANQADLASANNRVTRSHGER